MDIAQRVLSVIIQLRNLKYRDCAVFSQFTEIVLCEIFFIILEKKNISQDQNNVKSLDRECSLNQKITLCWSAVASLIKF